MVHINSLNPTEFTKLMLGHDSPISIDTYIKFTRETSDITNIEDLMLHTKDLVSDLGLEKYFLVPVSQGQVKCISHGGLESALVKEHNLQQILESSRTQGVISQLQGDGIYSGERIFGEKIRSKDDFFAVHGIVHSEQDNLIGLSEKLQIINTMIGGKFRETFNKLLDPKFPMIFNGEYFNEKLDEALNLGYSENQQVAVLYGDFCALKYANDTFGHQVGDLLLKRTATLLLEQMPTNSVVARMGNKADEFAVLLYGDEALKAEEYLNNFNQASKRKSENRPYNFVAIKGKFKGKDLTFPFYIPFGLVTLNPRQNFMHKKEIYDKADELYGPLKEQFYKDHPEVDLRSNGK